jgi:hypothetical protein
MKWARAALEGLTTQLTEEGYQFARPARALVRPSLELPELIYLIEQRVGPLPLAVGLMWSIIGSVDLTGGCADWPTTSLRTSGGKEGSGVWLSDALVIMPPREVLARLEDDPELPGLPLWPDALHKAGYSGDPETCVELPCSGVEGTLFKEAGTWPATQPTTLTSYLQWAISEHAGFPGLCNCERAQPRLARLKSRIPAFSSDELDEP